MKPYEGLQVKVLHPSAFVKRHVSGLISWVTRRWEQLLKCSQVASLIHIMGSSIYKVASLCAAVLLVGISDHFTRMERWNGK